MKSSKGKIYNFLRDNTRTTIATIGKDGKPEAATVKYALVDDSLIFDITNSSYRDYLEISLTPISLAWLQLIE